MSSARQIVKATTIVTAIALIVRGLGFVEKLLLAYLFGTGIQVDAYLIAYSIPFSAYVVLREVVRASYLPTFLRTGRTSEAQGWKLFSLVGTVLLLLLSGATIAGILFAPALVSAAAPGFSGAQMDLTVRLTRLVMPTLLLLGLSTLAVATLHAQKRFTLPALSDASFRAGPPLFLLAVVVLHAQKWFTLPPLSDTSFWAWPLLFLLAVGNMVGLVSAVVLGALGKLAIEVFGLRRHLRQVRPTLDFHFPPGRTVGRLAGPLLLGLTFSLFIGPLVENAFASTMDEGSVAGLAYARKIVETLATILPYTLGIVLLPFSAGMAATHDDEAMAKTLNGSVRGLTLIFLPATMGLMILREPFVRLLLERGAFDTASTQLTAWPLLFYAWALLPFALEVVVVQFHFARQDTLIPVITDVTAFALNVALILLLKPALGLGGIALAAAIARGLRVLALLAIFEWRVPAFRLKPLRPFLGRMVVASAVTLAALLGLQFLGGSLQSGGMVRLIAYLVCGGVVGAGAFFATAYLLGVEEIRNLWHQVRDRL
jgi:putative peptidoglycan lipid II flippase